jgi:hypothetical protein
MSVRQTDLSFEELFGADAREPDSLFERWMAGALDPEQEEAVVGHLLGSTFSRDEAMLRILVHEGVARSAAQVRPVAEALRVAVRLVQGVVEALAGSLQPLPSPAVTVRSGEDPGPGRLSFGAERFGPASLLHVCPAGEARFRVTLAPGAATQPTTEWALVGQGGRLVTAEPDEGAVVFSSVGAGQWSLERRDGELVSTSIELSLQVD